LTKQHHSVGTEPMLQSSTQQTLQARSHRANARRASPPGAQHVFQSIAYLANRQAAVGKSRSIAAYTWVYLTRSPLKRRHVGRRHHDVRRKLGRPGGPRATHRAYTTDYRNSSNISTIYDQPRDYGPTCARLTAAMGSQRHSLIRGADIADNIDGYPYDPTPRRVEVGRRDRGQRRGSREQRQTDIEKEQHQQTNINSKRIGYTRYTFETRVYSN